MVATTIYITANSVGVGVDINVEVNIDVNEKKF